MHRLFWKIFLSFWLTLIIFAALLMFAASSYLEHIRTQQDIGSMHARLSEYFDQGQTIAKQRGIAGLEEWLHRLDHSEAIPIFLIDEAGKDLLEREVPADITARLDRRREHGEHGVRKKPSHRQPIRLPDGSSYRMIPDFQSITLLRVLQRPRVMALPVSIAALVSALICLLLSRYLTFPLERLRRAAQQIAAGDLTQRVVPSMGGRRDEIADLAGAFDKMAERLERVFGAQRQLLSDASHELRSPLARLQVALGLARQRSSGQAEKELDRIEIEIERLNELIGQLLELARLEAGVDAAHIEQIDIRDLLEGLIEDAQFEAESVDCQVKLQKAFPALIKANAMLLRSAIENVVRNAIKYTKRDTTVEISMLEEAGKPDSIIIQVRDHGPGAPEEMLSHLFEPFVRIGEARDRLSGGHGLGLAIAERAVRLYGGEIRARNEPDGGLGIYIRLQRA
ncbi:ATP-binding protein [Nitrosospira sp. NpAV]|uniref:ATP-binding protein n=1 Tax=Nitrosospira sp. NpAV TaxID=58133 RepID=UPI0005A02A50|nr:ATP-binding protein [Nitrosospira sp. NpAV]KIO48147.1 histidine kinase [Nitrosospira sp. NpAV]